MATNIENLLEYRQKIKSEELKEILFKEGAKTKYPDHSKSFTWLLDRIKTGQCDLISPEIFSRYPFDENLNLSDWIDKIESQDFILGRFGNPQGRSALYYLRSLRPSKTGPVEKAFLVEPAEDLKTLVDIRKKYGWLMVADINDNAKMFCNENPKPK